MKIFLSYSRNDADFAQRLNAAFMDDPNYNIFTDTRSIRLGDTWRDVLEGNISECDVFVVIVTSSSLRSQEVEKEVIQAKKEGKKLIPCIYSRVKKGLIKWDLAALQGVLFEDGYDLGRKIYDMIEEVDIRATSLKEVYAPKHEPEQVHTFPTTSTAKEIFQKVPDPEQVQTSSSTLADVEIYQKISKGDRYYKDKNYVSAIGCYDEAIKIGPKNHLPYIKKGDVFYDMGKNEEAIQAYEGAIKARPEDPEAYDLKGDVYLRMKDYERALKSYDKALEIDPESSEYLKDRGLALYGLREYEHANSSLDKAISTNPHNAVAQRYKGAVLSELKKYKEAIKYFDEALRLDPTYSDAAKEKELVNERIQETSASMAEGLKYLENKDYWDALASFDNSISKDPENILAYRHKADALCILNRQDEAIKIYDHVLSKKPNDAVALKGKGTALYSLGKYQNAIEYFDKALKVNPKDADALNRKGNSFLKMTKPDLAMKSFQEALLVKPGFTQAKENLKNAESQLSQPSQVTKPVVKEAETYGWRHAIVIGINNYESQAIPSLRGAENDAREIYEQLERNGNFDISTGHFLLGPDATKRNILRAFSDIFRKDVNCDVLTMYFSGHGMVDEDNAGYIAPYDMDPEDPFVNGINMEVLRNYISRSKNKASVIMFFDCCYAGISAQDKGVVYDETRNLYAGQLQKLVEVGESIGTKRKGRGNIVLASSEATPVSKERNHCVHLGNDKPHPHGVFSFHLIEGLAGKAADPYTGIITMDSLRNHIDYQMRIEDRQRPMYYASESSEIDGIRLTTSRDKYDKTIAQIIKDVESVLMSDNVSKIPNSILIDIEKLVMAAKKVGDLISFDPNNKDVPRLRDGVDSAAKSYFGPTINWLEENRRYARLPIEQLESGLYTLKIPMLTQELSFDSLQKMKKNTLDILICVCRLVADNIQFTSEKDPQLTIFQANLRASLRNKVI